MNVWPRVGLGHDTHRLGENRPLILAGVTIPHPLGLLGHSDADVVLHALTDALLGAMAWGDIGDLFPDNDPANKDRNSVEFLLPVINRYADEGTRIHNVDVIVFAQKPKLSPHKFAMRENLAKLLGISVEQVNVKAKTGEHVGPIGREEAISAEVIVLVHRQDETQPTR